MRRWVLPTVLALAGCWVDADTYWDEASYQEEYAAAWCGWMVGCFGDGSGWTSDEACIEDQLRASQDFSDCTYDPDAARECVEGWWSLPCSAWESERFPEVCDQVHDCPGE